MWEHSGTKGSYVCFTIHVFIYLCTGISDWLSGSEPWWTAHTQDETELSRSGPVLQRCSGTVGEKTNSPRQNNRSTRQEGVIPCALPRWLWCVWVCVCTFICLPIQRSSVFPLYVQAFPRTDVGKFGCFFPISIGSVTGCPSACMPQTHPIIICWSSWLRSNMRFWWI